MPSPACGSREVKPLVQVTQPAALGPGLEPTQPGEQKLLCADVGSAFGSERPLCAAEPGRRGSGSEMPHALPGLRAEQVKRR